MWGIVLNSWNRKRLLEQNTRGKALKTKKFKQWDLMKLKEKKPIWMAKHAIVECYRM